MSFTIPDNDVAFNANQSHWYATDIAIVAAAISGLGVVTGCAVSAQGSPDMTVAVAAGIIQLPSGANVPVVGANATITTAHATHPRIDLISIDSVGAIVVTAGTAATPPKAPDLPVASVGLAMVYVPSTDTTIASNQITDKRGFVQAPRQPGDLVLLKEVVASAQLNVDLAGAISSAYDDYEVELIGVVPVSNDVQINMQVSTDGGVTFDSGANYGWAVHVWRAGTVGGATGAEGGATAAGIVYAAGGTVGVSNTAGRSGLTASLRLFRPLSASDHKVWFGHGVYYDAEPFRLAIQIRGVYESNTPINALRFSASTGNIASGTFRIYGRAKSAASGGTSIPPSAGAMILLDSKACTGLTTVDFTGFSPLYDRYVFMLDGVAPATNAVDFYMRVGTGGVVDTASHYVNNTELIATSGNAQIAATTDAIKARNNGEISNTASIAIDGDLTLSRPLSTTTVKRVGGNIRWGGTIGNHINSIVDGNWNQTSSPVDIVEFLFSSGAFAAGYIRMYGISKDRGGASLVVKEADGSPILRPSTLILPRGSMTDNGDGTVTLDDPVRALLGAPDVAYEFDANDFTGLTAVGTADVESMHATLAGHLLLEDNDSTVVARTHAVSPPFTAVARLTDAVLNAQYEYAGICCGVASPGKVVTLSQRYDGAAGSLAVLTHATPGDAGPGTPGMYLVPYLGSLQLPSFFAVIAASSTDVTYLWSRDGRIWWPVLKNHDNTMTVGSVGVHVAGYTSTATGAFDYLRVWNSVKTLPLIRA